jgi:hypothetical protein
MIEVGSPARSPADPRVSVAATRPYVLQPGWTLAAYGDFLFRGMTAQLLILDDAAPTRRSPERPTEVRQFAGGPRWCVYRDEGLNVRGGAWESSRQAQLSPGRPSGLSLAAACQLGLGTAPVRTSSAATSRSLALVRWEVWVRMVNASSSLILCRSIKMPLACSMQARDIIAVRS